MDIDTYFMGIALEQAQKALSAGEFPVGCVIADGESVLAAGFRKGSAGPHPNELDHAEIITLGQLTGIEAALKNKKLSIFCTMEPCLMCFGAIILAGISKIVYAYEDVMGGGTKCMLDTLPKLYKESQIVIVDNVMRHESLMLFKAFFSKTENHYWEGSLLADYTLAQE